MRYGAGEPGEQQTDRQDTLLLREIVREASHALANLNADRLEELAVACRALAWDVARADLTADEARQRTCREFVSLKRAIALTRANRSVLHRIYAGRVEYSAADTE